MSGTVNIFELTGAEKHIQGIRNLVECYKDNEALKKLLQSMEVRRDSFPPSELDNMEEFFEEAAKMAVSIAAQPKLMEVKKLAEKLEALEQKFELETLGVVEILPVEEEVKVEPIVVHTQADADIAEINTENLATEPVMETVQEAPAEPVLKKQEAPQDEVVFQNNDAISKMHKAGRKIKMFWDRTKAEYGKVVDEVRGAGQDVRNIFGNVTSRFAPEPALAGGASLHGPSALSTGPSLLERVKDLNPFTNSVAPINRSPSTVPPVADFIDEVSPPMATTPEEAIINYEEALDVYIPEAPFADTTSAAPEVINSAEVQLPDEFPIDELNQFTPIPDDLDEDIEYMDVKAPKRTVHYSATLPAESARLIGEYGQLNPTSIEVEYDIPETEKPEDKPMIQGLELSLENAAIEGYNQLWQEAREKNLVSEGNYPSLEELQSRLKAYKREEERKELERKFECRRTLGHERGGRSR